MSKQPFTPLQHPEPSFRLDHKLQQELFDYSQSHVFAMLNYAFIVLIIALVTYFISSKFFILLTSFSLFGFFPYFFWRILFFSSKGFKCSHCQGKVQSQTLRSRTSKRTTFLSCSNCKSYADTGVRQGNNRHTL